MRRLRVLGLRLRSLFRRRAVQDELERELALLDPAPDLAQLVIAEVRLPRLVLAKKPVLEMRFEDIALEGYQHHGFIKFPVAV